MLESSKLTLKSYNRMMMIGDKTFLHASNIGQFLFFLWSFVQFFRKLIYRLSVYLRIFEREKKRKTSKKDSKVNLNWINRNQFSCCNFLSILFFAFRFVQTIYINQKIKRIWAAQHIFYVFLYTFFSRSL